MELNDRQCYTVNERAGRETVGAAHKNGICKNASQERMDIL